MKKALSKLLKVTADPYAWVAREKKRSGKKVIGIFPMYLPGELVHAAGMLPVTIWEGNEPVTVGHAHVPPFNCAIVRSFIDDWLKGRLDFIDGLVFYDTCLQVRSLPFIVDRNRKPSYLEVIYHHAWMPESVREVHKSYLIDNLEHLKKTLEEFSGKKITSTSLRKSIKIYNKDRGLLRRLYELRRENPGIIKARDVVAMVQASMLMPKEEHSQLLEELLAELGQKQVPRNGKVRLIAVGSLCQAVPAEILDLVEDLGGVIVDDDLYVGSKYFLNDADPDADPIEALANRYFKRFPPCPTKGDWETDWSDYIVETARKDSAAGVLSFLVKYCPPHMAYCADIKRKMAKAGIPELLIELEHEALTKDHLRTRLQAFLEVTGGGR